MGIIKCMDEEQVMTLAWEKIVKDCVDPISGQWKQPQAVKFCNCCDKLKSRTEFYKKAGNCKECVRKIEAKKRKLKKLR